MTARPAPAISVILPARNRAATLPRVLAALRAGDFDAYEIVAVDDGSTDGTARVLEEHGVDVLLRHDRRRGQWASRNRAVAAARGRLLVFVDSDVVVAPGTLRRVHEFFAAPGPPARALIGLYSARHAHPGLCSRYKNAWIRYSYLRARAPVDWFFTGLGALPRALFRRTGGFAEGYRVETGGGDVEFGRRLRRLGVEIVLDRSLDAEHLKRFDLPGLLGNDVRRAFGWSRQAIEARLGVGRSARRGMANVSGGFVAGVATAWLTAGAALLGAAGGVPWAATLPLAAWAAVNARFWLWLARTQSPGLAAAAVPIAFVDQLACGIGVAAAIAASNASASLGWGRREPVAEPAGEPER